MQLLLICSQLSQPALLRRINGLEHDNRGGSNTVQGALGQWHVGDKIIPPFHSGALPRVTTRRMAILGRTFLVLSPTLRVVSVGYLLCQNLVGKLELLSLFFIEVEFLLVERCMHSWYRFVCSFKILGCRYRADISRRFYPEPADCRKI